MIYTAQLLPLFFELYNTNKDSISKLIMSQQMKNQGFYYKSLLNQSDGDLDILNIITLNAQDANISNILSVNQISPYSGTTTVNTGIFSITDTTQSTSTITGCLKLAGGCGIAKRLNVGQFITAPSITLTDTTNQITTGSGTNLTTTNFPASSGAVTITAPNVTSTLMMSDVAQNVTATNTFTVTQNMTTINRTSGNLTLQTTTSGIIALNATSSTITSTSTTVPGLTLISATTNANDVDFKINTASATKATMFQLQNNSVASTTLVSVGTAGQFSSNSVQGDTVFRFKSGNKAIIQSSSTDIVNINTTALSILSTTNLNIAKLTASQACVTDSSKNIISMAYTDLATASTITSRDASGNSSFNQVNTPTINANSSNLTLQNTTSGGIRINGADNANSIAFSCGSYAGAAVWSNTLLAFNLPISETDVTDATSTSTGSITTLGGISTAKAIFAGGKITTTNATGSTSTSSGSIVTSGGVGIAEKLYVGTGVYVPTTGGTQSEWNYFESNQVHTTKFAGPWASAQNADIKVSRNQTTVTIDFVSLQSAATIASTITMNTVLPSKWRPRNDKRYEISVQDNGTNARGEMLITAATGAITIYKDVTLTNFTGAGNTGFYGWSVSYECV
jgi:hypothetical protein